MATANGEQESAVSQIPIELWATIFLYANRKTTMKFFLSSKKWYNHFTSENVMKELVLHSRKWQRGVDVPLDSTWMQLYFKGPMLTNLIRNPNGDDEFTGWELVEESGDGWAVEKIWPCPQRKAVKCFVASYELCTKRQEIDLYDYFPEKLIKMGLSIVVEDWFCARWDCGSRYFIEVKLLDQKREVLDSKNYGGKRDLIDITAVHPEWEHVRFIFDSIPPETRYVRINHGGKDKKWWAGHYGPRITGTAVWVMLSPNDINLIDE